MISELLQRFNDNETRSAQELAVILLQNATLRSGFVSQESADYAVGVEESLKQTLLVSRHDEKSKTPNTHQNLL